MKPRNLGPNRPMLRRVAGMTAKPDGGVPQGRRLPLEAILSTAFLTVKYPLFSSSIPLRPPVPLPSNSSSSWGPHSRQAAVRSSTFLRVLWLLTARHGSFSSILRGRCSTSDSSLLPRVLLPQESGPVSHKVLGPCMFVVRFLRSKRVLAEGVLIFRHRPWYDLSHLEPHACLRRAKTDIFGLSLSLQSGFLNG